MMILSSSQAFKQVGSINYITFQVRHPTRFKTQIDSISLQNYNNL